MIFNAFFAALGQLNDPRFRKVLLMGLGITVAGLALLTFLFVNIVGWFVGDTVTLPWIGDVTWLDTLAEWSSFFLMLILSVFLMVPVASAVTSLFLDQVAQAVEDKHYPHLPPADASGLVDEIMDGLGF
ncbi:MAG: EI24 domain-containing protein, partial [Pseudomonadota bacterium]